MTHWTLHRTHTTARGTVRWDRFGSGDPVVLLHGTPFSSYVWRDVARALAATHEVYVWDMLGYGISEQRDGQDVSLAAQTDVFADLLDLWDLPAPAVVAHDVGGAVALRTHLLRGAAYRRLALVDAVALAPWGSPFFRLVGEHTPVFEALPAPLHEALVRAYVSSAARGALPPPVLDALVAPWLGERGQAAFYRQIAQADQRYTDEVQPLYPNVEIPVMVCWGENDTWIPVTKAYELTDALPGARLRTIPDAGHLVQEDAPAELLSALWEFLHEMP